MNHSISEAERLSLQTVDAVDLSLEVAGIGSRGYAFLVDWHIRLVAALLWLLPGLWLMSKGSASGAERAGLVFVPAALIFFLYHPLLEVLMRGRTPGKRHAGLRILTVEGHTPGTGALLIRNLFRLLDSMPGVYALGLLAMVLTRRRVRIGDLAAGTVVVYEVQRESSALEAVAATGRVPTRTALLVRELLQRWPGLQAPVRRALALRLLAQALGESEGRRAADEDDAALKARLQDVLTRG